MKEVLDDLKADNLYVSLEDGGEETQVTDNE